MEATESLPAPITDDDFAAAKASLLERAGTFAARVAPLYAALNWEWRGENDRRYVPNASDIEVTLKRLIQESCLYESRTGAWIGTGGLSVRVARSCFGDLEVSFHFILDDVNHDVLRDKWKQT